VVHAISKFDFDDDGPMGQELVVGGYFTVSGTAMGNGAARWDGVRWLPLGKGAQRMVDFATCDLDGPGPGRLHLYAAGSFYAPGLGTQHSVFRWDGQAWEDLHAGLTVGAVSVFDPDDDGPILPRLIAAGGSAVWQWNGVQWTAIGGFGAWPNYSTQIIEIDSFDADGQGPQPRKLIVGGIFRTAESATVNSIAAWDGSVWEPLGTGLASEPSIVNAMQVHDLDGSGPAPAVLIVGGRFSGAGGSSVRSLAQWNGATWDDVYGGVAMGLATNAGLGSVMGIASHDADGGGPAVASLVVSGSFNYAGGVQATNLARLDGGTWRSLGPDMPAISSLNNARFPLASFRARTSEKPVLVVGGEIHFEGTRGSLNLAQWDGALWSSVAAGFSGKVNDLAVFDADGPGPAPREIVAGGYFTLRDIRTINDIARYDGQNWRPMNQGGGESWIWKLANFDPDGSGPEKEELWAAGSISPLSWQESSRGTERFGGRLVLRTTRRRLGFLTLMTMAQPHPEW
jgi:hypothetical protein